MSRGKPPVPANDDLAAFRTESDFDNLTDEEIQARIEAGRRALGRELQLRIMHLHDRALSRPSAKTDKSRH